MKKLLSALTAGLFILGCNQAAEALDVDFVSDVSIASHGVTIGLDQDGDEFSVVLRDLPYQRVILARLVLSMLRPYGE